MDKNGLITFKPVTTSLACAATGVGIWTSASFVWRLFLKIKMKKTNSLLVLVVFFIFIFKNSAVLKRVTVRRKILRKMTETLTNVHARERVERIELSLLAWKAKVLPLNYTRDYLMPPYLVL